MRRLSLGGMGEKDFSSYSFLKKAFLLKDTQSVQYSRVS